MPNYIYYPPKAMESERLTRSEMRCVERAVRGETNKAISAELGIAVGTVKTHLYNAMLKMGCHTRLQLYLKMRDGLPPQHLPRTLSDTQLDAIKLLAQGFSDAMAAHTLGVAVTTYKGRLQAARAKLGLRSRLQLLHHIQAQE